MTKRFIVRGDIKKEPAMIIEDQLIVSPGEYYGIPLTSDKIKEHIRLTDWTDKWNTSLIYGHRTNDRHHWKGNPSPDEVAGYYSVPVYKTLADGVSTEGAYSNIYIYEDNLAKKLAYGRLKCGVSTTFDLAMGGIKNLSVIDNPKCKQAFLNLADDGETPSDISITSPAYLNLADEPEIIVSDSPTIIREENSRNTMNENTDKTKREIELEKEVEELKKQIAEKPVEPAKPAEPIVEPVKPTEPVAPEPVKVPEPVKEPVAPVVEPAAPVATNIPTPEPVVITPETPKEDSKVVDAIEKMTETVTAELKKASAPATTAPTSPEPLSSRDDEVTQSLVDKYKSLHNLNE